MAVSLNLITFDESVYTKEQINEYTNEELIDFIHATNDNRFWEILWIKTKNCLFKVYNTTVNSYNKDKNSEEVFSVLLYAWMHAVKTYDKEKATSEFYKYAIYIIKQKYIRYASRTNAQKDGKSIKHLYLEDCLYSNNGSVVDPSNCSFIDVIEDESSLQELDSVLDRNDIEYNLKKLKNSMPDVYNYIIEYFFNNKTFAAIANKYEVTSTTVQRGVKKGLKQLNHYFIMQEKLSI